MEKVLLILCGGEGKRLGAITRNVPKPLIKINGKPFLSYLLEEYSPYFDRIILLAGYKASQIEALQGGKVSLITEKERLGTGGAVINALSGLPESFFVCNGDTFLEGFGIDSFIDSCAKGAGTTLLLCEGERRAKGTVEVSGSRVSSFREKAEEGTGLVYGGFVFMKKSDLAGWPEGKMTSMETEIFPKLARSGELYAFNSKAKIFDIGTPAGIKRFKEMPRK